MEIDVAGVKFRGGKMAAIFMGLTSALAGLYGAFEFWTDYKSLRQTVVSYKAPDLSGFDRRDAGRDSYPSGGYGVSSHSCP